MLKYLIYFIVILPFFISCSSDSDTSVDLNQVKRLELYRVVDSGAWIDAYSKLDHYFDRAELVYSIGKTRNTQMLSFLDELMQPSLTDTLLKAILYAIGQIPGTSSEDILLRIPFDSLSDPLKKDYIAALGRCGTPRSHAFFIDLINRNYFKELALQSLAISKRREKGTFFFPKDSSASVAYYANYVSAFKNIPGLIAVLNEANPLQRKYLFKAILKKAQQDSNRFHRVLSSDSLSQPLLVEALLGSLKQKSDWKQQLYAIQLAPYVKDSLLVQQLNGFTTHNLVHLRLAAMKSLTLIIDRIEATSLLLTALDMENSFYVRGQVLILLTELNKEMAFRILMQDLDKGDDNYKAALIDALAKIGSKTAIRTIRQFIQVPNFILANRAFENLVKLHRVRTSDWQSMLHSDSFSSVTLALDYAKKLKRKPSRKDVLDLYKRFKQPAEFEVQKAILNYFSPEQVLSDSILQKTLWQQASHPFLQRLITQRFSEISWPISEQKDYADFLPAYLCVDSLPVYEKTPQVLIKTEKGDILLELYPDQAPFTVQNFLHLVHSGFYTNLTFHRVIPDFVIQGGDPLGDGWGSTTYLVPSEDNYLPFERGSLGIATSGFDTGACQFFICQSEQPHLTGNYTNFGYVKDGMSVIDQILPGDKILEMLRVK